MTVQNVGIKAIQYYIPGQYVNQSELETFDGVSSGKYTVGLGQTNMAFVNDREDIYSMSLTALKNLIDNYNIDVNSIGRLEVGTETLLDKSKSVKSVLMQLFGENSDVEGIDNINACYGGTAAVINCINWVQSEAWDGRDAIVVCGDIAIYEKGAARPTGGAGTVAILIGPDAPIVFEPVRGTYMEHAYDFYKPNFTSEYPVVDGHFSLSCYVKAVDYCYKSYSKKAIAKGLSNSSNGTVGINFFDYNAFHVPTCKLVAKSYARLLYNDFIQDPSKFPDVDSSKLLNLDYETSLIDKTVEKTFMPLSKEKFNQSVKPSLELPTNVGNMYTGSVWGSLCSLISIVGNESLQNKRIGLFSYGSGLAASMLSVKVISDISSIVDKLNVKQRLELREKKSPEEYEIAIALREKAHLQKSFKPEGSIEYIPKNSFYLTEIDDKYRRFYEIKN
jgi:hydroxymethylglutaryl-CoA synthase